jgi:hypothetical protein
MTISAPNTRTHLRWAAGAVLTGTATDTAPVPGGSDGNGSGGSEAADSRCHTTELEVSLAGGDAERDGSGSGGCTVPLAPDASAVAQLQVTQPENYSDRCTLRIRPLSPAWSANSH